MNKLLIFFSMLLAGVVATAQTDAVKIGIIGLDTSHSVAFSQELNKKGADDYYVNKFEVVAAYPYGTKTIPSASKRIKGYIETVKKLGVEIVGSIDELLKKVDCVFIETNDGRLHLEQAAKVLKSGKKCFIDKPLGSTLAECMAIYKLAEKYQRPIFSSSALRFSTVNADVRAGKYGVVKGADAFSPHHPEAALDDKGVSTHPDFGYYGIHGVEILYTLLGTGCDYVSRVHSAQGDIVSGVWKDGRLGTFRALTTGPAVYGGTVFLENKQMPAGEYMGYKVLLDAVLKFFETDVPPVSKEETLEIFAFMEASNLSLKKGGKIVHVEDMYQPAEKKAEKLLKPYLP